MGAFFSLLLTREGKLLFCEKDYHEATIQRAGLRDNKLEDRDFVRIVILDGDMDKFREDEWYTLPKWYNRTEAKLKCLDLLTLVMPVWDVYNKAIKSIRNFYGVLTKSAWDQYLEDRKDAENSDDMEVWNKLDDAWMQYLKNRTVVVGQELYKEAMILLERFYAESLSTIDGYVKGG